jgi:sulfur-oxidizing protein SoxB
MNQTAITYPYTTLTEMSGDTIKSVLEDICDNLFNPDPYLQQGGDMVRTGGLQYACNPTATIGNRISDMTLKGKLIESGKRYKVAGWAPVAEGSSGRPVWEVVSRYLQDKQVVSAPVLNLPQLSGGGVNAGQD